MSQEFFMLSIIRYSAPMLGVLVLCQQAQAHGYAGDHMFISTLLIDDPNVAYEASLPTFQFLPNPAGDGGATRTASFEFDKRIAENFGFVVGGGYTWLTRPGDKAASGWNDLSVAIKWKPYVNPEHEFMVSVGLEQELARTGATGVNGALLNNADTGVTTPNVSSGKGFGDLPISAL